MRLFTMARKVGTEWSDSEKRRLAMACMGQLSADMNGFSTGGPKVSTNIQAIYTLSICANIDQLTKLSSLHDYTRYHQACLYTHAKTRSDLQWLQDEFEGDVKKSLKGMSNNIQSSSYAIGVALRKEGIGTSILSATAEGKIVNRLCEVVQLGRLSAEELTCCLLALGWICDQRESLSEIDSNIIHNVLDTIRNLDYYYSIFITINEQILKFAQNYPTNFKTASSDAPFFMNWCRLPIRSVLT